MRKIKKDKWKSVPINLKEIAPELHCFEELVEYTAIREKETLTAYEDDDDNDDISHKRRKKKKNLDKKISKNVPKRKILNVEIPALHSCKKKKIANVEAESSGDKIDGEVNLDSMNAWDLFNLPTPVIKALALKKFMQPTKIQELTLPEAVAKRKDVLGAAETGSGKTLAFAIPIVSSILEAQSNNVNTDGVLWALILTPTRELTIQVKNHIRDLCVFTNIKVQEIVGGLSAEKQNRKLSEKPQIIVGTPGRLWELIRSGHDHLSKVEHIKFFVIDEADRMFEKNHFKEFTCLLERLNYATSSRTEKEKHWQTFVFSATLTLIHEPPSYVFKKKKGKPKPASTKITPKDKLQTFIDSLGLKNPTVIDITTEKVLAAGILETCIHCPLDEKDYYLYYILKVHPGKKIIFANSVSCVKRLHRLLNVLQCNPKILYADMPQNQRLKNLNNFEKNPNGLLLATDVAARGLDIPSIDYIIHYQVPTTSEIYVHRSGRSVRGFSATGTSILLCCPSETYQYDKIKSTLGKDAKLQPYTVSKPEIFSTAKRVVDISRQIEHMETKMRNVQTNVRWMEKCAKEMDIILDEDEIPEKPSNEAKKARQREIKNLRSQLKALLSKPVLPLHGSLRYPTFETVQLYLKQCSAAAGKN